VLILMTIDNISASIDGEKAKATCGVDILHFIVAWLKNDEIEIRREEAFSPVLFPTRGT